jgi:NADH dehydrogenase FAD-containing subunit
MAARRTRPASRKAARPRPVRRAGKARPRIVVVGAGFAGLSAAQRLDGEFDVTVIDRSAWFEWRPNLHELISRVKRPSDLRLPLARLVSRAGHRFVRGTVTDIDAEGGRVVVSGRRAIDFDACIVAVGGTNDTFGVPGAARYAMPFKSVDDCAAIGRRLAQLARRRGRSSVVIVGGGLEGVEALGEILRKYRRLGKLRVSVVEAGARLLPGTPPTLDARVRRHCEGQDVRFLLGAPVTSVTRARVHLRSGEALPSDLTIWTGGATSPPLLIESGLAADEQRWAPVNGALRSTRFRNAFVAGDAAQLPHPLGKQAYYAMQMGVAAAENAARVLAGRAPRNFRPSRKPVLIAFGDLDTFLLSGRTVVASPALAAVKEAVFQVTMAQLDPPLGADSLRSLARRLVRVPGESGAPKRR